MEVPPGFEKYFNSNQVCRLKKALYGLKQLPWAWFERFSKSVIQLGYQQSQADHTLFIKAKPSGKITAVIVYVDDIILTGNDIEEMKLLKTKLAKEFEIKDLRKLRYFSGIEVARSKKGHLCIAKKVHIRLAK